MAQFDDASKLAQHQLARQRKVRARLLTMHQGLAEEMHREAWRMTNGNVSESRLRKLGHPYGRREGKDNRPGRQRSVKTSKGKVRLSPLPINRQTGRLQDALRMFRRNVGTAQTYVLQFAKSMAPYAKYVLGVGGTKKMLSRRFWETLRKSWRKKNFDLLVKLREYHRKL